MLRRDLFQRRQGLVEFPRKIFILSDIIPLVNIEPGNIRPFVAGIPFQPRLRRREAIGIISIEQIVHLFLIRRYRTVNCQSCFNSSGVQFFPPHQNQFPLQLMENAEDHRDIFSLFSFETKHKSRDLVQPALIEGILLSTRQDRSHRPRRRLPRGSPRQRVIKVASSA